MMTLEEAIKHCKDVALSCSNKECALEHFQLLKWLQEYSNILEKHGKQESIDPDILIQQRVDALADIVAEQKPADKVEPKFRIGDWVIDKQGIVHQITNVIENVTYHTYGYDIVGGGYFNDNTEGVRLWTIQDAKNGDILSNGKSIVIFKGIGNERWNDVIDYYIGLFADSQHLVIQKNLSHWGRIDEVTLHPATKEQCNLLFKKMKKAGYRWDAEKRLLSLKAEPNSEQKPAEWKPTDEQMDALVYIIRHYTPAVSDTLGWESLRTVELMISQLRKP